MIGELRDLRTQLLIVAGVLLLADVAAVGVLVSPLAAGRAEQQKHYEALRQEKIEKMQAAAPVRGIHEKIDAARRQETAFLDERLTKRYSAMSEEISHTAHEAGVEVSRVHYDDSLAQRDLPAGFQPLNITIQVKGSYEQNIRFLNAMERQKMMLLVDGVSFSGLKDGELTLAVKLSTFLRSDQ
jgi:Tfp pilus assembly protein PilO